MFSFPLVVVLFFACASLASQKPLLYLSRMCLSPPYDEPQWACTVDGHPYENWWMVPPCYENTRFMEFMGQKGFSGFLYPGIECGCPNYCGAATGNGVCKDGACACRPSWKGVDCLTPSEPGFVLPSIFPFPPIVQTFPSTQYVDDPYGEAHPVFNVSKVAVIRVRMNAMLLGQMVTPKNLGHGWYPTLGVSSSFFSGIMASANISVKGDLSRAFAKKSFKIRFPEKVHGLKEIDLKAMSMDSSCTRELVNRDVMFSMNLLTQRMSYALLYINDVAFGAYLMQESFDSEFVTSRLGKATKESGVAAVKCEGQFKCKENSTVIRALQAIVESHDDAQFAKMFPQLGDISSFLNVSAFDVLTGQVDGPMFNMKNVVLVTTTPILFTRNDLDLASGAFSMASLPSIPGGGNWWQDTLLRLLKLFPALKPAYLGIFDRVAAKFFSNVTSSPFYRRLQAHHALISSVLAFDYSHALDYGYSTKVVLAGLTDDFTNTSIPYMSFNKFLTTRLSTLPSNASITSSW